MLLGKLWTFQGKQWSRRVEASTEQVGMLAGGLVDAQVIKDDSDLCPRAP